MFCNYCQLLLVCIDSFKRPIEACTAARGCSGRLREVGAYLGSNCRHLDGLERLVRFALLDAQSAG